eukprot:scaffold41336_cov23-Tisochrysis_lutea.AAC.5
MPRCGIEAHLEVLVVCGGRALHDAHHTCQVALHAPGLAPACVKVCWHTHVEDCRCTQVREWLRMFMINTECIAPFTWLPIFWIRHGVLNHHVYCCCSSFRE